MVVAPTRLDVDAVQQPPQRAGWGQNDVPMITIRLNNPGVDGLTSNIVVASISVTLTDTIGVPVTSPSQVFERLRVVGPMGENFAVYSIENQDSATITFALSPLPSVIVNAPLDLTITTDIADSATVGAFRIEIDDSTTLDARDSNTLAAVPVVYQAQPVAGGNVVIEAPADTLLAYGTAGFPAAVTVGETNVLALTAFLRHGGIPGVGRIRVDEFTVTCQNEMRQPLVPATYISGLRVIRRGVEIANVSTIPASGDLVDVPLPGLLLEPGEIDTLEVRIDVSATAPESFIELLVRDTDVRAADANLSSGVVIAPDAGATPPITSGLTQLLPPATELVVGLDSDMPAALAPGTSELLAATLSITNTASAGSGAIRIEHLVLRAADNDLASRPIGQFVTKVMVYRGGGLIGESGTLTVDSTTAFIPFPAPISSEAQSTETLELRLDLNTGVRAGSYRVGLTDADLGIVQPASALLRVRVRAAPGQEFPMWTDAGAFSELSLAGSFSNFPNPFAAGGESTSFVYYLPAAGNVTLRLWTVRGEAVRTIREETQRNAGLYQDDRWDGRNGRGTAVVHGVYIAELVVNFADGSSERLLRKVAVVR
jgi:hypothetical protein